jgi:hypothetical protein
MLPKVNQAVIETATMEWFKNKSNPFKFCLEQIDLHRQSNPEFLLAIDNLLDTTFTADEKDQALNKAKAFSVILFALKIVNNQLEVDDLNSMYD